MVSHDSKQSNEQMSLSRGRLDHQTDEDDAVGDARAVAAERMDHRVAWQERGELVPDRLDDG